MSEHVRACRHGRAGRVEVPDTVRLATDEVGHAGRPLGEILHDARVPARRLTEDAVAGGPGTAKRAQRVEPAAANAMVFPLSAKRATVRTMGPHCCQMWCKCLAMF